MKVLKDAIYEKVMQKKQDLEKINEELITKEVLLREQEQILETKRNDFEKIMSDLSIKEERCLQL